MDFESVLEWCKKWGIVLMVSSAVASLILQVILINNEIDIFGLFIILLSGFGEWLIKPSLSPALVIIGYLYMAYKDNENKPEPDTETNKLDEVALFKRLIEYARERYVDVPITSSKPDIKNKDETPSVQETPVDYQELMIIDDLIVQKEYQLALNRLLTLDNKNPLVKRLLMVCHYFLDNDDDFIALIGVPDTVTEFAYLGDVLERSGKSSELREIIDLLDSHETISISEPYKRLKKKIGGMYNGTD